MEELKSYYKLMFEEDATAWVNKGDDRKLFSNMYYQIMQAIDSMIECKCKNLYVIVAFEKQLEIDEHTMRKIQKYFKEGGAL